MMDRKKLLAQMAKAEASGSGINLRDGEYTFIVKALKLENGYKGARFVAELYVKESRKISVVSAADVSKALDVVPNEVGSSASWVQLIDQEGSMSRTKSFIFALYNEDAQSMPEQDYLDTLDLVTGGTDEQLAGKADKNPACGMEVKAVTKRILTKKGLEITALNWMPVPDAEDRMEGNRAMLESGGVMGAVAEAGKASAPVQQAVAPVQQAQAPAAVVAQAAPSRFARLAAKAAAK